MKWFWLYLPIIIIGVVHIISGAAVISSPEAIRVTALAGLIRLGTDIDTNLLGICLVIVGSMALLATKLKVSPAAKLLIMLPQQMILFVQMWSITYTVILGVYPDGYTPAGAACLLLGHIGSCFILADQIAMFSFALGHTATFCRIIWEPELFMEGRSHAAEQILRESLKRTEAENDCADQESRRVSEERSKLGLRHRPG